MKRTQSSSLSFSFFKKKIYLCCILFGTLRSAHHSMPGGMIQRHLIYITRSQGQKKHALVEEKLKQSSFVKLLNEQTGTVVGRNTNRNVQI